MSTVKCFTCTKTVYPLEQISVGVNIYHKICFKCEQCNITLNIKNAQEKAGQLFCLQHVPKEIPTQTADRHDLNEIKAKPKVGVVNQEMRGELVGQKSLEGTDSMGIGNRMNVPKVGVVNEQLRGELVGQKSQEGTDSLNISTKMNAPKVNVVNDQIRGELAGQKSNLDDKSISITQARDAPKVEANLAIKRGDASVEQVKGESFHSY